MVSISCLSVHPSVCLSFCLRQASVLPASVYQSVRLSVCPAVCASVYRPVYLPVRLSMRASIRPSVGLYVSVCLRAHVFAANTVYFCL